MLEVGSLINDFTSLPSSGGGGTSITYSSGPVDFSGLDITLNPSSGSSLGLGPGTSTIFNGSLGDFGDFLGNSLGYLSDAILGTNFVGNEVNKEVAEMNVQALKDINAENIAFQQQENALTRSREDNAIRRAAADLTAAGLSKTLAAGNPASAQSLTAPHAAPVQNEYKYDAAIGKLNLFDRLKNLKLDLDANNRANRLNEAQVENIEANTVGQNNVNNTFLDNFAIERDLKNAQAFLFNSQGEYYDVKTEIEKKVGTAQARSIEKDIEFKTAEVFEINARTNLTKKQLESESVKIASEIIKQEGYKLDNMYKQGTVENLVIEQVKLKLQANQLKHDLMYGQLTGLPIGATPSGLFGGMYSMSQAITTGLSGGISNSYYPYNTFVL